MAIIFEDMLKKKLSMGLAPVYILFGEDGFLKKNYTDKISRRAADPQDVFNYCKFGAGCQLQDAYDAAMQLPFMSDKKCIILSDYDFEHCSKPILTVCVSFCPRCPTPLFSYLFLTVLRLILRKALNSKSLYRRPRKTVGLQ